MGAAPFIDHRRAGTISHAASSHLVVVELAQPRRWNDHLAGFDRLEDLPRAFREKAAQADIVLMAGVGGAAPGETAPPAPAQGSFVLRAPARAVNRLERIVDGTPAVGSRMDKAAANEASSTVGLIEVLHHPGAGGSLMAVYGFGENGDNNQAGAMQHQVLP